VARVPGYRSIGLGFDSRHYQIFWEVVGLERGPLSLVSTNEELPGRKSSGSGQDHWEYGGGQHWSYGGGDPSRWSRDIFSPQKLALTSPTSGGRSVGIVRLRTKATELLCLKVHPLWEMKCFIFWETSPLYVVCYIPEDKIFVRMWTHDVSLIRCYAGYWLLSPF
jgi:hypothetical protein